jgi:hypothetical protein
VKDLIKQYSKEVAVADAVELVKEDEQWHRHKIWSKLPISGRNNGNASAVGSVMEYRPAMASGLTEIETASTPGVHTSLSKSLAAISKFHVPQFCSDLWTSHCYLALFAWCMWTDNTILYVKEIRSLIFYVWLSVHHKLIYIKNQRDATWQYVY